MINLTIIININVNVNIYDYYCYDFWIYDRIERECRINLKLINSSSWLCQKIFRRIRRNRKKNFSKRTFFAISMKNFWGGKNKI